MRGRRSGSSAVPRRDATVRRYHILGRLISLTVASACLASATLLVSACSDSPATPTPVLPPPLGLTCPGPVSQLSPTGQPIGIRYGGATATGGTPPVQITCTPASHTLFQVGRTTVTCHAAH